MAELKTRRSRGSVEAFLKRVPGEERRGDCERLVRLLKKATGKRPEMWGTAVVGFGSYHYRYASGREGDWFEAGFSPRKQDLTLYIMAGTERFPALLARLGKHKTGRGCLYLKGLAEVDLAVLEELVTASVRHIRKAGA